MTPPGAGRGAGRGKGCIRAARAGEADVPASAWRAARHTAAASALASRGVHEAGACIRSI